MQSAYTDLPDSPPLQLNCERYLFNILNHFCCISFWILLCLHKLWCRKLTITGEELQSLPSYYLYPLFNVLLLGRSPVHYPSIPIGIEDAHLIPTTSLIPWIKHLQFLLLCFFWQCLEYRQVWLPWSQLNLSCFSDYKDLPWFTMELHQDKATINWTYKSKMHLTYRTLELSLA